MSKELIDFIYVIGAFHILACCSCIAFLLFYFISSYGKKHL